MVPNQTHIRPPLDSSRNHLNAVHTLTFYACQIDFNAILLPVPRSESWSLPFRFCDQTLVKPALKLKRSLLVECSDNVSKAKAFSSRLNRAMATTSSFDLVLIFDIIPTVNVLAINQHLGAETWMITDSLNMDLHLYTLFQNSEYANV